MKIARKRSLSIAFYIGTILTLNLPMVHADTLSHDKQTLLQLQQAQSQLKTQVNSDQVKALTLKKTITSYDDSLKAVESQIADKNNQILTLKSQETSLTKQLSAEQTQLSAKQSELEQLVQADYENGDVSYLSVLFQSNSFADLLTRLHDLAVISQAQQNMVQSVQNLTNTISDNVKKVQSSEDQVAATKAKLQSLEATQQALVQQKQQNLHVLDVDIQSGKQKQGELESQIHLTQTQISAIEAETRAAEQMAANPNYVHRAQQQLVSANANQIISYAQQFMGIPYVWGGTSPSGFDCSGYTQYVFRHFGVDINRTSEEQFAAGVPVDKANLQPGDLVFFSTYGPGATHVGIYMGNGLMIDSQDMGVSIDNINNSYWGPKYIGARRYIK